MTYYKNLVLLPIILLLAGCAGSANWQALQKSGLKAYETGRMGRSEAKLLASNAALFAENPLDERALPNLQTLGYMHQISGNDSGIDSIYQLEWDILEAANLTETTAAADALYKQASHAHKIGNFPKADSLYLRVLGLDRKLLPANHPYLDLDHYKIAAVKYKSGDLLAAETYLLTVLDLRSHNFTDISQLTEVITTCAAFYELQGLYAKAEPFYRRALETFSRHDPENTEVVDLWLNYSKLLDRLEMSEESMIARAKSDELAAYYKSKASQKMNLLAAARGRNTIKFTALDRGEIWLPIYPTFDIAPAPVGGMNAIKNNIEYPTTMLRYDVQGTIVVESWIDTQGQVRETFVTAGQEVELYDAAIVTVRKTKFYPAFHRGRAENSWVAVPVTFELLIESEGY